jgi:hypothetical protein
MRMNRKTFALAAAATLCSTQPAIEAADMTSGTWHIGLQTLWGGQPGDDRTDRKLDIYAVFKDGQWVNALATARRFNTSIHFVEESDVVVDPDARTVRGSIKVLITPDLWVPADGLSFHIVAELRGELRPQPDGKIFIGGAYSAKRADGKPLYEDKTLVEGNLIGGVGQTEPNWENSIWKFAMSQEVPPGTIDMDAVDLTLGIADAKVQWGLIGLTAQAKWPAARAWPVAVEQFEPVSDIGIARGRFIVTGRHLHSDGDPNEKYQIELVGRRVQGLTGGRATITRLDAAGQPTGDVRYAAGRGNASRGGGNERSFERALWRHEFDTRPWWVPVEGFVPPQPGEHPRLLFRNKDLPALRARAATPEGKAIIERLRQLLGNNGEALPTQFNPVPPHNHNQSKPMPMGAFTTWHAAGFGFLYQMTGDKKYAELARGCVQLMLDGKMDIDNRYAWFKPGTALRCGSVLGAMAYAYDFCYDAWPEEFRKKIALEIQNFDKVTASAEEGAEQKGQQPKPTNIEQLVGRTGYPPGSNHYGSLIGGTGVALLAIKGDPGVNTPWVEARLAELQSNIPRMLELGFGDAGWYAEALPPSRLSTEGGFLELLHAMRVAAGRDYINAPRPNAKWLTLRWISHLGGHGYASVPSRGVYGGDQLYQDGLRASFALGFGAVPEKYRPALLWSYRTYIEPHETGKFGTTGQQKTWNAIHYPHFAVYAFLSWPLGVSPQNPAAVLPLTAVDTVHGYFITRNRWQDNNDIIVTHLIEYGPKGYYKASDAKGAHHRPGVLRIWGHGLRTTMNIGATGTPTFFERADNGSFTLTQAGPRGLAVDLSGASGAECVIVAVGGQYKEAPGSDRADRASVSRHFAQLTLADATVNVYVFTLQTGAPPEVKVEGNHIKVGTRTYTWDGGKLRL